MRFAFAGAKRNALVQRRINLRNDNKKEGVQILEKEKEKVETLYDGQWVCIQDTGCMYKGDGYQNTGSKSQSS
jgi:hypothetical protein